MINYKTQIDKVSFSCVYFCFLTVETAMEFRRERKITERKENNDLSSSCTLQFDEILPFEILCPKFKVGESQKNPTANLRAFLDSFRAVIQANASLPFTAEIGHCKVYNVKSFQDY